VEAERAAQPLQVAELVHMMKRQEGMREVRTRMIYHPTLGIRFDRKRLIMKRHRGGDVNFGVVSP